LGRFASTMGQLHRQEMESDEDCLLLAVGAGREKIAGILADPSIHMAMDNCPHQTVLVGPREAMERVHLQMQERGLICEKLSFRRPYHTPLFEPLLGPLKELFAAAPFNTPTIPVYSCTTAQPFPADPDAIRDLAVRHWAAPLRFREMIEEMHRAGARLFVEVGPRGNLTSFVEDILRGKQHIALPSNAARRSGLSQLNHLIAQLAAHDVRFDLASHDGGRTLNEIALPWDAPALEDAVPQPVDLAPATYPEPAVESVAPRGRAEVMNHYLAVMEQFLEMQQEVTEAYLSGRSHRPDSHVSPHDLPPLEEAAPSVPDIRFRPLLGEVVHWVPGQELVARRRLDLEEDLFALDHTVGGRAVSKVDPEQHGVPVTPMTFTLEILAEAGSILAPGHVVTAIKQIRLLRWLAYEFDEPGMIEVSARVAPTSTPGEIHVMAEIRDLGPADHPHPRGAKTAEGMLVLAPCYAPPPPSEGLPVANIKPVDMTVEQVYHNLFHGPSFQGVKKTVRGGDEGIEAEVEVLPRDQLFRSIPDPVFQMDPVLLDVVLHPLATWHLHQADLAGRIMLPVGVDAVEFFAPPAVPGTRYLSRAWVSEANLRSFSHRGETATPDGNVYIRLDGVKCWRFYVPFGEDVNFHGPKDQYFLGRRWSEIEKQTQPDSANPSVLVRLEIPADLKQAAMNRVTAQVTLTKQELREFSRLTRAGGPVHPWLFDRIAAKDAMRLLFFEKTGERLFPADMECQEIAEGRLVAHRREHPDQPLGSAVLARAGQVTVAMTADCPIAGLALEILDEAESPEDLRDSCVAKAIRSTGVLPAEAEVGAITWISETLARATLPQGETWLVHFARDEDYLVAWTRGEKGSP
ncbi:MAG: polyketide synthase dehydratase domain-containing protein, partial [Gemmataceae bacterium]